MTGTAVLLLRRPIVHHRDRFAQSGNANVCKGAKRMPAERSGASGLRRFRPFANQDRIAKPEPCASFGAAPPDVGTPLASISPIRGIAGSVAASSSANPVFVLCLSCRMGVGLGFAMMLGR